ncbi:MAG TPA: sterol desaturase family protein [Chryseolinea sp.]
MSEFFWNNKAVNYAALAIPAFFLFLGLEYVAAIRQRKTHIFNFESSVANISIGIAERLLNLFLTASFYGVFTYIYEHFALWSIPNTWVVWGALILATDLVWYWYHRLGHEINLFWAAHIVHHHSEEFNYSVSARITTLQSIVRNVFWSVLPLIGFHPAMVMTILVVHGTYSFFTHTQLIRSLGWLEHIFITPSHHRVHHASNEKYLNKNYGDLFVFWDKLFGTFQKEEEQPVYGLTHPLKSYSFIWQHFHYFLEILYATRQVGGIGNKLKIIFGSPEMLDQNIRPLLEKRFIPDRRQANALVRFKVYLVIQLGLALVVLFFITLLYQQTQPLEKMVGALFILITLVNCGALLEQRRWIYYLEYLRMLVVVTYASYLIGRPELLAGVLVVSLAMLWPMQKWYLRLVYGQA